MCDWLSNVCVLDCHMTASYVLECLMCAEVDLAVALLALARGHWLLQG